MVCVTNQILLQGLNEYLSFVHLSEYRCSDRALGLYTSDVSLGRWVIIIREYRCSDRALGLYTSDVSLGRWVIIIRETVCRQWFGRAWVV